VIAARVGVNEQGQIALAEKETAFVTE
jgi:hypothetical protein